MEQTLRFAFGIDVKSAGLQRDLGFRNSGDGGATGELCRCGEGWLKQAWRSQNLKKREKVGLNRPGPPKTSKGWLKQARRWPGGPKTSKNVKRLA